MPGLYSVRAPRAGEPIRIAGAGPAGLACALELARAGQAVEVYEKRSDAGKRFLGDLQGLENWSSQTDVRLESPIRELGADCLLKPFSRVSVSDGVRTEVAEFARPLFYVVRRGALPGALDQALKQSALDAGVRIRFGEKLPDAAADIVATGVRPTQVYAAALGCTFETRADDLAVAFVNNRIARRGYAYLLIADGQACLCTTMFADGPEIGAAFAETLAMAQRQFAFDMRNVRRVGGVVSVGGPPRFAEAGRLYCGEAAGLQDFLWGFGIRHALESGRLAARCRLSGEDYGALAARQFLPYLRAGVVNRFLWECSGDAAFRFVLGRISRGSPSETLRRAYSGSAPLQRALYPFARFFLRSRYATGVV